MNLLVSLFVFIFGLCLGSFLNVIIIRLQTNEGLRGRSRCPQCDHQLAWIDLIPLISFLMVRGKCRYCSKKISIQYPLVEGATGLIFLALYHVESSWITTLFLWYIASSLIVIFVYDAKHFIIPDVVLIPAVVVTIFYRLINNGVMGFGNYLLAACFATGFFLLVYIISHGRWIGFGDVKLAVLLGLLLGWPGIVIGLFISSWLGALWGMIFIISGEKKLKSQLPFAPFLIGGTGIALFFGSAIVQWYMGFLM